MKKAGAQLPAKPPLTRPATAGESAVAGHPQGIGLYCADYQDRVLLEHGRKLFKKPLDVPDARSPNFLSSDVP